MVLGYDFIDSNWTGNVKKSHGRKFAVERSVPGNLVWSKLVSCLASNWSNVAEDPSALPRKGNMFAPKKRWVSPRNRNLLASRRPPPIYYFQGIFVSFREKSTHLVLSSKKKMVVWYWVYPPGPRMQSLKR